MNSYQSSSKSREKLGELSPLSIKFLIFLLFAIPVINTFQYSLEHIFGLQVSSIVNYIAFGISLILLLSRQLVVTIRSALIILTLALAMFVNYFFTDYASTKWFFNFFGFLLVFASAYNVFFRIDLKSIEKLHAESVRTLIFISGLIILVFLSFWIVNFQSIITLLWSGAGNQIIAMLTDSVGINKQQLGNLMLLFLLAFYFYRIYMTKFALRLHLMAFLLMIPAIFAVRTLFLSLSILLLLLFSFKSMKRFVGVLVLLFSPFLLYVIDNWQSLVSFVASMYDRWNSLLFALDTLVKFPLGLGNGGYHLFVEKNNDLIVSLFGSKLMTERGLFWQAPESDLVYFIASWGFLSLVFFLIVMYVIYFSVALLRIKSVVLPPSLRLILAYAAAFLRWDFAR